MVKIFYPEAKSGEKVSIDDNKKLKKSMVLEHFRSIIPNFVIMEQVKEEEMFIQIAELVTNYHQHILTALNRNKNG